jgi:hypothetical protein
MRQIHRIRLWATPILLAILVVLLLAYSRKIRVLSLDWLKINKDALTAVNSLCSTLALVVASILAYYRFFRGRTLTTRAELSIDINAISGLENISLHSISVSAKNIGTVTIWEPKLIVYTVARRGDGRISESKIDQWHEFSNRNVDTKPRLSAIDSGESADFSAENYVDGDVWVVTYTAILSCTTGDSWSKAQTVKGAETKSSD